MKWCVLKGSGGYLGTRWEGSGSGALVRPRTVMVPDLAPAPYHVVTLSYGDIEACEGKKMRIVEVAS